MALSGWSFQGGPSQGGLVIERELYWKSLTLKAYFLKIALILLNDGKRSRKTIGDSN